MIRLINWIFRKHTISLADEVAYYKSLAAYYMEG